MDIAKRGRNGSVRVEDVARDAGVSPITVSRTLSTPELVKPETRERVLRAVERLGYVVNTYASSLRSGRSAIVSMFVSGIGNPHIASIISGYSEIFEGTGFHLMMTQIPAFDKMDADQVAAVLPLRPAALVFTRAVESPEVRSLLAGRDIPVMETWDKLDDPIDMVVGFCHRQGGRLMGQHFLDMGFKHPAYAGRITGRGEQRLDGFRKKLAEGGVALGPIIPLEQFGSFAAGHRALEAIFEQSPACDAIFFSNDTFAVGAAIHAAASADPARRRVAIAGHGDILFSDEMPVPITTVRTSGYAVGRRAGAMLLRRLNGGDIGERVVTMEPSLQVRASTTASRSR